MHLHLVDAGEVEFDRVLGGGDVLRGLVQLRQRRIEGNRLAAAGRPGDQHHAEGLVDRLLEMLERRRLVPQLGHVQLQAGLVQEAEDDLFAEQGRQHGDAEIHVLAAAQLDLDAAVLGQPALGDVQLRHDLEAGGDGVLQLHGRLHDFVEHAVDAVADPEQALIGLDMYVAGFALDGVGQDEVDQLDDRRVFRGLLQRRYIHILMVCHHFHVFQVQAVHHVGKRGRLVVEPVDRGLDAAVRGDHHLHVVAGHELDVVDGEDVGRVAHGQDERGTGPVDRDRLVFLHHLHRDQLDHGRIDVEIGQVDGGDAVLLGKERRKFRLADESFLDEDGAEPELAAGDLLLFEGLL